MTAKVTESFAAICASVAAGDWLKSACAAAGIKVHVFQFKVLKDPTLRARWLAAKNRGLEVRLNRGVLRYADEILWLIESGMSMRKACASDARFPSRHSFVAALRIDPVLQRRYDDAIDPQEDMDAKCRGAFDDIVRGIKAGGRILEVLQPRKRCPDYNVLSRFLKSNPEFDARYRAAFREREAGPNAIGQAASYSERELRRAAADLMLNDTRHISTAHVSPTGPHAATLLKASHRDAELRAAVETAIMARRARLRLPGPKFVPTTVRVTVPAKQDGGPRIVPPSLSSNELWQLAIAALPARLDSAMRNDVAADIIVAVLQGDLSPDQINGEAHRFISAHNRMFSIYRNACWMRAYCQIPKLRSLTCFPQPFTRMKPVLGINCMIASNYIRW